ncbi:hypothetical protein [Microtetraspora glauca]|uniref:Integrase n=1 Tax=Microtetraspora glauca TaxID=1996 RepID=A0ABV3G899_MICGL
MPGAAIRSAHLMPAGHQNTVVTETVYSKQIRPVLMQGAETMDDFFSR